ncbi:hypothetical protein CkaCkLH20_06353 [Colletotrichum karsti]|uniref:Uncharacterized protein n=1 Tax=Colletotrichum karsti TaxID=1095194 RepID=A0A9P6I5V7_9PEZI|nr:uncharacterized protein CkaCkLH20_06353 [Colletotrichum karsti]KAF9876410.1 hypothetical protein CkaCkLH20_06353 [Colletotrichum karsti]
MKAAFFTLAVAFFSAAAAQQKFRCRCADAGGNNIAGVGSLCTSKGGKLEPSRDDLCIQVPSRFTNEECAKVQQGATGDCIVDDVGGGSTVVTTVAAASATPKPKLVRGAPWEA